MSTSTEPLKIETGTGELLAELESGVATITLNRPEARNALSDRLSPAFRKLLPILADDPEVRCLLVTGAGNAFCAGGDVKGMTPSDGSDKSAAPPTRQERIDDLRDRQIALTGALYEFPKPTLAALPGPAAGAGLSIALALRSANRRPLGLHHDGLRQHRSLRRLRVELLPDSIGWHITSS